MVRAELDGPSDLIAQSLGGLVALRVALSAPEKVRRLVLTATSGGIPVRHLGGTDWRTDYRREFPKAANWITDADRTSEDLSAKLPAVTAPSLLIWGDADSISPLSVGQRLGQVLPHSVFHVIRGGAHDLARTHASEVASLIAVHLG